MIRHRLTAEAPDGTRVQTNAVQFERLYAPKGYRIVDGERSAPLEPQPEPDPIIDPDPDPEE